MNVARKIKIYREGNMTQKELADKLGVTTATIQNYESGRREPKFETLQKISEILDIPLSLLVGPREQLKNDFRFSDFDDEVVAYIDDITTYIRKHLDEEYSSSLVVQNIILNYKALLDSNNKFNNPFVKSEYSRLNDSIHTGEKLYKELLAKYTENFKEIKLLELNHVINNEFSEKIKRPELLTDNDIKYLKDLCKGLENSDIPLKLLDVIKEGE